MKRTLWVLAMGLGLAMGTAWAAEEATQAGTGQGNADTFHQAEQSMGLIIVGDGGGHVLSVSTGAIIRPDGILLTAYHAIKGAREVQVRLADGEIYDQVDLMGFDERRDVAALHFTASGLACFAGAPLEQALMGDKIHVLTADGTMAWSTSDGILGPVRLADEVMGAGHGYRVIQFMAPSPQGAIGGALVSSRGQLLGIITGSQTAGGPQFAVPLVSVAGLPAQGLHVALGTGKNLSPSAVVANAERAPEQQSTTEGQPGPDGQAASIATLAKARTLRVITKTVFFNPSVLQEDLTDDSEFRILGLSVANSFRGAELLVTVNRPLFTYDWTYSVNDPQTGAVLATGKVTAMDGARAAKGISRKLVQEFEKARAVQAAQENPQEALSVQQ
jgi:hypothetical protein